MALCCSFSGQATASRVSALLSLCAVAKRGCVTFSTLSTVMSRHMKPTIPLAYRYLEADFAKQLWAFGHLRISTTQSVGWLEDQQRDDADGALDLYLDEYWENEPDPHGLAAAARLGIVFENVRNVRVQVGSHFSQVPGFMLCLSASPDAPAFQGKDWVLEVPNPIALGQAITKAAQGKLPPYFLCKQVEYMPRHLNARDALNLRPDPFIKDVGKNFEREEELRIFWPTPKHEKPIFVTSLEILAHIKLVRVPSTDASWMK